MKDKDKSGLKDHYEKSEHIWKPCSTCKHFDKDAENKDAPCLNCKHFYE